jgi:hypothetical protein
LEEKKIIPISKLSFSKCTRQVQEQSSVGKYLLNYEAQENKIKFCRQLSPLPIQKKKYQPPGRSLSDSTWVTKKQFC